MQAATPARIFRSALLMIVAGAAVAGVLALGAWHLLPYEALDAETFPARFVIWEGAMWGLGLACTLFGVAALLDATDLYGARPLEQVQQQVREARTGGRLYSELPSVPWMLLACGASLIVAAVLARSGMLG